ncbi:hypothetical protein BMS3Abin02_02501 [bacterium BMS3Abin02]|nr:hypothetical protein BMS3Abin02_02501 [bacterium BMS3Abin02]GBE22278.1 hypothetical protein BMS3Bbin01_01647 [bacterium BMS3Bbin01]
MLAAMEHNGHLSDRRPRHMWHDRGTIADLT